MTDSEIIYGPRLFTAGEQVVNMNSFATMSVGESNANVRIQDDNQPIIPFVEIHNVGEERIGVFSLVSNGENQFGYFLQVPEQDNLIRYNCGQNVIAAVVLPISDQLEQMKAGSVDNGIIDDIATSENNLHALKLVLESTVGSVPPKFIGLLMQSIINTHEVNEVNLRRYPARRNDFLGKIIRWVLIGTIPLLGIGVVVKQIWFNNSGSITKPIPTVTVPTATPLPPQNLLECVAPLTGSAERDESGNRTGQNGIFEGRRFEIEPEPIAHAGVTALTPEGENIYKVVRVAEGGGKAKYVSQSGTGNNCVQADGDLEQ